MLWSLIKKDAGYIFCYGNKIFRFKDEYHFLLIIGSLENNIDISEEILLIAFNHIDENQIPNLYRAIDYINGFTIFEVVDLNGRLLCYCVMSPEGRISDNLTMESAYSLVKQDIHPADYSLGGGP